MGDGAVVALEEVLGRDLPVGVQLRLGALEEAESVEVDARSLDHLGHVSEVCRERAGFGIRVDEDQRPPGIEGELNESQPFGVVPALARKSRRCDELAVESVRPCVIRALEGRSLAGPFAHERTPVSADVQECPERALLVPYEHDRNVADSGRDERAALCDLVLATDVLP